MASGVAPARQRRTVARDGRGLLGAPILSTLHATVQSLAHLAPIFSVGFFAYLIAGAAGADAPLVILLTYLGALALAWTFALYARRFAGSGTVYEWIAGRFGTSAGALGAGIYFLPLLLTNMIPLETSLIFQGFTTEHLGFDPGWWIGGVVSIPIVFLVNYLNIRLSVRAMLTLTACSAVPFLLVAVAVIATGGDSGNSADVFMPGGRGAGSVFTGLLFGAGIFLGFENAACLGEETERPHRAIPRALLAGIAVSGAFLLLMLYAAAIGFGPENVRSAWGENPLAFASLGDRYVGHPVSALIYLAVLLDAIAIQIAISNKVSRGYFALARDGLLPRPLAAVSQRNTPVGGLTADAVAGLALLCASVPFANRFDVYEATIVGVTVPFLLVYVALAVGALYLLKDEPRGIARIPLVLIGGALPVLALYGTFHPFPTGAARTGIWLALGICLTIGAWFAYLRSRRQTSVAGAARHTLVAARAEP